jgi:hypothetical protein
VRFFTVALCLFVPPRPADSIGRQFFGGSRCWSSWLYISSRCLPVVGHSRQTSKTESARSYDRGPGPPSRPAMTAIISPAQARVFAGGGNQNSALQVRWITRKRLQFTKDDCEQAGSSRKPWPHKISAAPRKGAYQLAHCHRGFQVVPCSLSSLFEPN